jgi:hypothetical protein
VCYYPQVLDRALLDLLYWIKEIIMGKSALFLVAASLLLPIAPVRAQVKGAAQTPAAAPALAESVNHVMGYTAWDDDYFYVAVQVNKPTLNAKNGEPFSHPLEDDAVIISLQTDDDHNSTHSTAHTVQIAISAAGGTQVYSGPGKTALFKSFKDFQDQLQNILLNEKDPAKQDAGRVALLGKLLKFQVSTKGAPRASGIAMPGYTIEIAVPWSDLGGKPNPGTKMGINIAAQSTVPGSPNLQSLSPQVKTAVDLDNPSLWGEILFNTAPQPTQDAQLVAPRVFNNKPVIDGEVSNGEWNGLSVFAFGEHTASGSVGTGANTLTARVRPDFTPHPARPVVPLAIAPLPTLAPHRPQPLARMVMARYDYSYQADTRKEAPTSHVLRGNGSTALAHHPLEGPGPWFSYDRADWHRRQLLEVRQAGIDVILPVYRGAARDRQLNADKGLIVLATALQSLRQSGQEYPQVGLYLDTTGLTETDTDQPDLRKPEVQAALYDMVRDFYRHIPTPFRCSVPLTAQNGGRVAYPVFLSSAAPFADLDSGFVDTLRARFARDFDGADLLVLGATDFKAKANLDGYFTETRDKGFQSDAGGWVKTANVGAGYDAALTESTPGAAPALRSRRNGDTYRADWQAALALTGSKQPDWVLLDGWNDYTTASEVAGTYETGYTTADLTKEYTRRLTGMARRGVKFLWHDAPAQMVAGQTYQVHLRLQNTGMQVWGPITAGGTPVALAYRWLRDGRTVANGTVTTLTDIVNGGQNLDAPLAVKAAGVGSYTLQIGLTEAIKRAGENGWLGEGIPGTLLEVPVTITAAGDRTAPWGATLVRSDLPDMLETGGVYTVQATLRNDGTTVWRKADGARVTLRLYRTAPATGTNTTAPLEAVVETPVSAADATALLKQDVAPGQEAIVQLQLPLTDEAGKPLPAWTQDDLWTYTARWEVADDSGGKTQGVSVVPTPLAVVNYDFGVRFISDGTPTALPSDRRLPVRLSLQNVGPQIWKHGDVRVGYHWYYADGSEYVFEDETTPVAQDVPPGGKVTDMLAWITAPPNNGTYYLVWDLKVGDTWASTTATTRVYDQIVRPIQVINGRLTHVDLTKAYNLDGISDADDLRDGDFDGQGRTFPADLLPPYAIGGAVPSGIWMSAARSGPESPRRISFVWGPKDRKEKNFVSCQGQKIDLGKDAGQCHVLHIVAASSGQDIATNVKLVFQEPSGQSEDLYAFSVSRWDQPPTHGDEVAFLARRHHEAKGIQPGAVALYHYTITVREPRKLIGLVLPNEPSVKIAAITIEK